jgi:hypothetical protein
MSGFIKVKELRRMKFRLFHTLSLLMVASLLLGCAGTLSEERLAEVPSIDPPIQIPPERDSLPSIEERHADVEADYNPIAENDSLRLYFNEKTTAIIVEDKRYQVLWRSSPADLQDDKSTTNIWKSQIVVPIQVAYVDAERSQSKNVKPAQITSGYRAVEDGIRVSYDFEQDALALDLIYTLKDDCLNVVLPNDSIEESGENSLVSMEVLPYFGAVHDGEEGYIVYPDGSGALMHFTAPHSEEVQKMVGIVYGSDASGGQASGSSASGIYRQSIPMPVFGMVRDNAAFVGFLTQGDFDSGVSIGRAGKGVNYNHVWPQFVFRRQGRFSITGGQPAWLYQPDRIPGDRQIRYCFLNTEKANYSGMAERYRDFLINERGATRLSNQNTVMSLGFFMGTERRNWILRDMISMTTFDQAGEILDDLAESGVTRLDVTLWNWDEGSISIKNPQSFPVDERLGGEEALRRLTDKIHQRGQRVLLTSDYINVVPGAKNVLPYLDAVRGVDGLPLGDSNRGYLLNPEVALERFAKNDIAKAAEIGVDGLHLLGFASLALPDKNNRFPLTREGFAAIYMEIADLSTESLGKVSMIGSNIYASLYSDFLQMVPLDSTHYDIFDETIPFFQMAVHGLTQYSGIPYNLISDSQRMFLRQVEYGAVSSFILTQESSSNLSRTNWNDLYSSEYGYWKEEVIAQYQIMDQLSYLNNQFILSHQELAEGIYQTTYEDGTRIIVNYNAVPYSAGTVEILPLDFVVVKGE